MYFHSWADFINMGGYAGYVWSAFSITAIVLVLLFWLSVRRGKQAIKQIQQHLERQARIEAAKGLEDTL